MPPVIVLETPYSALLILWRALEKVRCIPLLERPSDFDILVLLIVVFRPQSTVLYCSLLYWSFNTHGKKKPIIISRQITARNSKFNASETILSAHRTRYQVQAPTEKSRLHRVPEVSAFLSIFRHYNWPKRRDNIYCIAHSVAKY